MPDLRRFPSIKEKLTKTDILSTDSTFKVRDIVWYTDSAGVDTDITSADFGAVIAHGVHEPRTPRQEFFTFDPTTIANFATTGIVYITRGLRPGADYTTSIPTLRFNHPTGTKVLLYTNAPAFYNDFANKENDETISQTWTFTQQIMANTGMDAGADKIVNMANPTLPQDAATKAYADALAIAGAPDASEVTKGIIEIATVAEQGTATSVGATGARLIPANSNLVAATAGVGDASKIPVLNASGVLSQTFLDSARTWGAVQSLTADNLQITTDADSANDAVRAYSVGLVTTLVTGEAIDGSVTPRCVAIQTSDGLVYRADADNTSRVKAFGFINTNALITTSPAIKTGGIIGGFAGLTINLYYYVSDTAGAISTTPSTTTAIPIGIAISTTEILLGFGGKIASGTVTHANVGAGTQDVVTTIGFLPRVILFSVSEITVQSISGGVATRLKGPLGYIGLVVNMGLLNLENAAATALTSSNIQNFFHLTSVTISHTSGGAGGTGLFSLNAVGSTGFTTRIVNTTTSGGGATTQATLTFTAFE